MNPLHKILLGSLSLAALALGATACNEVDEADRYIEMPTIEVTRAVLLQDFTGQRCTNCPAAHLAIEQLEEQYGDALIAVSIHSGVQSFPITNTRYPGLATPTGEEYDVAANVGPNGYPTIVVDWNSPLYVGTGTAWIDAVRNDIQKTSTIDLTCRASLSVNDAGDNVISVDAQALSTEEFKGKLMVWIVENDVKGAQMGVNGQSGFDYDYVHNNVFRAAIGGTWGTDIELTPNTTHHQSLSYTIDDDWAKTWDLAHVKIVAFVYNDSDGCVQATRTPLEGAAPQQ